MAGKKAKLSIALVATLLVIALLYALFSSPTEAEDDETRENVAAVAVAPIEKRPIELRRTFSGALEARAKFVVAPKVSGRIERIPVDISDVVERGETVVVLDDAEFAQTVNQAEADLAVAQAHLTEATSAFEIAKRENQRTATLRERGIASESEFDNAQADLLAKDAQVKVAEAQAARARSALESARIRLGYTDIAADWNEGDAYRVVAERYVDEGETVSANEPLLLIVDLNPIGAVIYVTERDYGLLRPGQAASFTSDAFPGRSFEGRIQRISPIFRESSRQARVELTLENPGFHLKPGMFVRAEITLTREEDATVVPYSAITRRRAEKGVFVVDSGGETVTWVPVELGIRSGETVQILDDSLSGRVVTLGQHLIDDNARITIPDDQPAGLTAR